MLGTVGVGGKGIDVFIFFQLISETGTHCVAQPGLELLGLRVQPIVPGHLQFLFIF